MSPGDGEEYTVSSETEVSFEHADCVKQAASDVFSMTCGVGMTEIADNGSENANGVLIAVISIIGDVDWTIYLGLPRVTAESVALKFAGFEIPFDSEDMGDAVGEMANILAGQVKSLLDSRGVTCEISLPSVMRADSVKVLMQKETSTIRSYFETELGNLWTGVVVGTPSFSG